MLLQDVEGIGAAGAQARVNHGYARNFLVPNKLARVVPRPRRGAAAAAAAEAAAAAPRSAPGEPTLERQQQQFDKLMKTLTGSTLVRVLRDSGGRAARLHDMAHMDAVAGFSSRSWHSMMCHSLIDRRGHAGCGHGLFAGLLPCADAVASHWVIHVPPAGAMICRSLTMLLCSCSFLPSRC